MRGAVVGVVGNASVKRTPRPPLVILRRSGAEPRNLAQRRPSRSDATGRSVRHALRQLAPQPDPSPLAQGDRLWEGATGAFRLWERRSMRGTMSTTYLLAVAAGGHKARPYMASS